MLRQNSLRLQKLIEDLLSFSMLTRDALRLKAERLALDDLIREVAAGYSIVTRAKSVGLELALERVEIEGDRDKLKAVVDNLISNAVKYSPSGGRIAVSLASRDGSAVIDVSDQGPGIAPEERERIFEAFFQGASAKAGGPIKGSGLGLSIAREFVRLHGGAIQVVDEDTGAHLRVSLPRAGREAPRAIAARADAL
jgi:two-component system sensor histidine kinase GlrK